MTEDGYASLWAVVALAVLTTLAAMAAALPLFSGAALLKYRDEAVRQQELENALLDTIELLQDDPNPQSDSPADSFFRDPPSKGGVEVAVRDISSALNLNAMSLAVLNDDELRTRFRYFTAPAEMKQRLASEGFFIDPKDLEDYAPESSMEAFFTLYGLWNPAVSDEVSLERLLLERTGDASVAASMAARLVSAGSHPESIGQADYEAILGAYAEDIRPLITDEAVINVHFAEEELLRVLLNRDYDGKPLPDPGGSLDRIKAARLSGEIPPTTLRSMVPIEEGQEAVFALLGTVTWFWEITVESDEGVLKAILARVPSHIDGERPDFQVVSRRLEAGSS